MPELARTSMSTAAITDEKGSSTHTQGPASKPDPTKYGGTTTTETGEATFIEKCLPELELLQNDISELTLTYCHLPRSAAKRGWPEIDASISEIEADLYREVRTAPPELSAGMGAQHRVKAKLAAAVEKSIAGTILEDCVLLAEAAISRCCSEPGWSVDCRITKIKGDTPGYGDLQRGFVIPLD